MNTFVPSSLPPIDEVAVVNLCGLDIDARNFITMGAAAPEVRITGEQAQWIATSWRSLPSGHQKRCHIPPFGLRFYSGRHLVFQASICWECNNIFGEADAHDLFYEFDASHTIARELLRTLEEVVGRPAAE